MLDRLAALRAASCPRRGALCALVLAGLQGCAGPLVGDLLHRGQPVFGVDLRPGPLPDEATLRQHATAVERPEPGVLLVKGPPGGGRDGLTSLSLFFVGEGEQAQVVAAAIPGEQATAFVQRAGTDDSFFRREPKGPPVGWMDRFGMLYADESAGSVPQSYIGRRAQYSWTILQWVLVIWDLPRFAERFGPLEPRADLERRWGELAKAVPETLPPAEAERLRSATLYSPEVVTAQKAVEEALRRMEKRREAEQRVAELKAGTAERHRRLAGLYGELGRMNIQSFEPSQWWGRAKEVAKEIGELLAEEATLADGEGLFLTAVSLRGLSGHCRHLGGDPQGKEVMDEAARDLAARRPPFLDHLTTQARLEEVYPAPLLSNVGEYLRARLWDARRGEVAPQKPGAIALTTRDFQCQLSRTASSRWDEDKVPYEEQVSEIPERNLALIAKLEGRLGEIGTLEQVHRDRMKSQSGDQAAVGVIADQSLDPSRPHPGVAQGGGLSGSADWRIMDAQQQLRSLDAEGVGIERQLERLRQKETRTVTRYRFVRKQLWAWEVNASNDVEAVDPLGGRRTARQVFTGKYDADATLEEARARVEPIARKALEKLTANATWVAAAPLLEGRLSAQAGAIKDAREAALFRFYYLFEEPRGGWEPVVLKR